MKFFFAFFAAASLLTITHLAVAQQEDLTKYVDPFIGTAEHGHVFPGATMPFGMVQLSPDEETTGWDWCSGYNYSSNSIMGFSHTHLSGTGAPDYGDILFMPTVGKVKVIPGTDSDPSEGYRSTFSHSNETASPGFYSVLLARYDIKVELTATDRCGMHKYIFPASDSSNVILDLEHGIGNQCTGGWVKIVGDRWIEGMRQSRGWASDRKAFFVAEFSKQFKKFGTAEGDVIQPQSRSASGDSVKAFVTFSTKQNEAIVIKVGISAVSLGEAKENLAAEMPNFDFNKYRDEARDAWNKALGKIQVEGGMQAEMVSFYTALYHTMIAPNIFEDVDGKYFGMDHKIHKAKGFTNYSVFSLWDIYRAEMPLISIIEPKFYENFVISMIEEYRQQGLLPVWPLWGNETYTMIGYPTVPILFDAYMKGYLRRLPWHNFDIDSIFAAIVHSADLNWQGLRFYRTRGFIPADKEDASVSKTLEYSFEDWCIAQLARQIGRMDDYREFNQMSSFYQNVFDSSAGYMRGKLSDGKWISPFDPYALTGQYTEGNAWQYTFLVPEDVGGLIKLFGGKKEFAAKLDSFFNAPTALHGRFDPDVTGMVGQDAQGNEPGHEIPYLYDYAGQPWQTEYIVRTIMSELYPDSADGLPGNDDCGQMSAWYVMSAMGFYEVTPGQNIYEIGSPLFKNVVIDLGNGKKFTIEAENASDSNIYIQSAELNGKPDGHDYLTQSELMNGDVLHVVMLDIPGKKWGTDNPGLFVMAPDHDIVPMVSIHSSGEVFYDSAKAELTCEVRDAKVRYTLNGIMPNVSSALYSAPLVIRKACTLKAVAVMGDKESMTTEANFVKSLYPQAQYAFRFSEQYNGGGAMALTDGRAGTTNYQGGQWQGFEGTDLDATIDLTKETTLHEVSTGFLEDTPVWIFLPEYVEYYVSQDGKDFKKVAEIKNTFDARKQSVAIKHFTAKLNGVKARFLRVLAKNIGVCPAWHPGAGGKAWVFVDEVKLK